MFNCSKFIGNQKDLLCISKKRTLVFFLGISISCICYSQSKASEEIIENFFITGDSYYKHCKPIPTHPNRGASESDIAQEVSWTAVGYHLFNMGAEVLSYELNSDKNCLIKSAFFSSWNIG